MKLSKLNLKGKGELLNEFELKEIKGGYYQTTTCRGTIGLNNGVCQGECDRLLGGSCRPKDLAPNGGIICGCY